MINGSAKMVWPAALIALIAFAGSPALADIYRYLDKDGVWHFTNIRKDTRYQLYIKTSPKKPIVEAIKDYDTVIKQAADKFGVDPLLIKAVIKAESDFDSKAVSQKGAKGLMQLMPGTAEDLAVSDSFDAAENIFGGTRYLAMLLRRFKEDKGLALAAYNAGPEKVQAHKGIPPITETETFVKRVLGYYNQYVASGK